MKSCWLCVVVGWAALLLLGCLAGPIFYPWLSEISMMVFAPLAIIAFLCGQIFAIRFAIRSLKSPLLDPEGGWVRIGAGVGIWVAVVPFFLVCGAPVVFGLV